MKILVTNFNSNPNIGLYAFCNDKFCLIGEGIKDDTIKRMHEVLKVPVHKITLCGTSLVGVFCAGNSKRIILPDIVFDSELAVLDRLKIEYRVIKTKLTALGNNMLCNDNGCIVNPEYSPDTRNLIKKALDVPIKVGTICKLDVVGALGVLKGDRCIVGRGISDEEKAEVEDILKVEAEEGTVSMGSSYVSSGMICNSNGIIISSACSGPEKAHIGNIFEIK